MNESKTNMHCNFKVSSARVAVSTSSAKLPLDTSKHVGTGHLKSVGARCAVYAGYPTGGSNLNGRIAGRARVQLTAVNRKVTAETKFQYCQGLRPLNGRR